MEKLVIHVGAAKSGTTSLQENIFARLAGTDCVGRPHVGARDFQSFRMGITRAEDWRLDELCRPFVTRVRASPRRKVILSDETLRSEVDGLAAQRLARYFPGAHILITVRSQFTALPSYYRDSGRMLKHSSLSGRNLFVTWREFIDHALENPWRRPVKLFDYYGLYRAYRDHFPMITVLTFEEMISAPEAFLSRLGRVTGHDADTLMRQWTRREIRNPGESVRSLTWFKLRSRIPLSRIPLPEGIKAAGRDWVSRGRKARVGMTDADRARIAEIYGPGNLALAREAGLRLEGYPALHDDCVALESPYAAGFNAAKAATG